MLKAHKIRLNPTPEQEAYFLRAAGTARFAYNWGLARYKELKAAKEKVDWNNMKIEFRGRVDTEFPFVREVTKCAPEQAIADLRQSIGTYYKAKKSSPSRKLRFPGPRRRSRKIGGFGLNNDKFRVDGHSAFVPKLGEVNMAEPLRFDGKIMSGRITEKAGRWYLTVTVDCQEQKKKPSPEKSVGIDFGLSHFATLSTGEVYETQGHFKRSERKLRLLQRGLARKKKVSNNRRRWKLRVSRFQERIRNQRLDFLQKFSDSVTTDFSLICIEDLALSGLCRTRFAKSFSDAGIGEAVRQLQYKAEWRGGIVQKVDRFFPSTKLCRFCGTVNHSLTLADREWECPGCGAIHDRDYNASCNIELEGIRLHAGGGSVGETAVELLAATLGFGPEQAGGRETARRTYSLVGT